MAEEQRVAVDQVGLDGLGVEPALDRVRREHHDEVGLLAGLERRDDPQPLAPRPSLAALGALGQPDPHVDAGVAQRQRVRVALAAVAEHGHVAALDDGQVGVVVVVQLGHGSLFCCGRWRRSVLSGRSGVTRAAGGHDRSVIEREPRPTPTMPDCTSSRMPYGSSTRSSASSLSALPVASMVTASGCDVDDLGAEQLDGLEHVRRGSPCRRATLTRSSSRCTDVPASSSTILMHLDQLVELLGHLLERQLLDVDHDGHPGDVVVLGRARPRASRC